MKTMIDPDHFIPAGYDPSLYRIRHSAAHVLAQSVLELFPDAKLGIGPPTDDGFYYDFDLPRPLTPDDLDVIERSMKRILSEGHDFVRDEPEVGSLRRLFADQPYKLELIDRIEGRPTGAAEETVDDPVLSTYRQDSFVDLCRGPHVGNTREIDPDAVKLLHTAGAYWRGDSTRPMLQRVCGTAWQTPEDLKSYLERVEDARRRDHRTLGRTLDLFSTSEAVGPGLVLWHPKAGMVRYLAERFCQQAHVLNGYQWVYTPHIGRSGLWKTSGHLDFFKDSMYAPIDVDGDEYYLKPMSCPFHIEIFKSRPRSYRDLPLRYAEYAQVYRYELSGTLHGMTRVRGFCQDDAHSFCQPAQAASEIRHALRFSLYVLRTFGLENFRAYISTRPEGKAIGDAEQWEEATQALTRAVEAEGLQYAVDEGGGAFYGPKIDLKVEDTLGREWQLSTVQFDFNLPERFGMEYAGSDGRVHRPYMIHRALFGSAERFFAMLVEQYAGAFPLWLAPTQVWVAPVAAGQREYADQVAGTLRAAGMRVQLADEDARLGATIREAQLEKIPYVLVVGKREMEARSVSVRSRDEGELGVMTVSSFLERTEADRNRGSAEPLPDD